MELVYELVMVLHFLGLASLLGGALVQLSGREGRAVNQAMLHGALTQLVTGVVMVGLADAVSSLDKAVDYPKIGTKLLITLVVAGLCWANRRRSTVPDGLFFSVFALSVLNVAIAVFWG